MVSYTYCDSDAYKAEKTKASSLTPNQFHKICPGSHSSNTAFGQPRCGDGSNFAFFYSAPLKQLTNDKKIIIEFQGGGACWDSETCGMQQDYLTFPEYYDNFVGLSCSEIEYGAAVQGGNPLSLLCAKKIGNTDFREYNTIVVPYCTQDVHIGDAQNMSYDGNTIQHVGAHNMVQTLNWVYQNFPNPSHIFLTGCSAGGTAIPIAYDLINKHYNTLLKGGRSVNINAIMDSSVYLTPPYFLQYGFPNWNPGSLMKKIGFNYNKYSNNQNYPDLAWGHVLKRGSNKDSWGFVTHSYDPISLMFYQYMSGNGDNNGRSLELAGSYDSNPSALVKGGNRQMEDDLQSQWWTETSASMEWATKKHRNVQTYIINGEGHCSFGLYYPLQESGFEEWATPIVKEKMVIGNRGPSIMAFLSSLAFGGLLIFLTRRSTRKSGKEALLIEATDGNADSSYMGEVASTTAKRLRLGFVMQKIETVARPIASKCESWPWTAGYLLATTIYFIIMLASQGFAHPLDNPGFGPSAVGLSIFGINNPSLVVYKMEHFRIITSTFVCSGLTTYCFMVYTMYKTGVEKAMTINNHAHWHFPLACGILSFAINLFYTCIGNGASCGSLALALGLNTFSGTMRRRSDVYPSSWCFTILVFILGCSPLFPFDSLVALTTAVITGFMLGMVIFVEEPFTTSTQELGDYHNDSVSANKEEFTTQSMKHAIPWKFVHGMGVIYLLMYLLVLFAVPRPNANNVYPYLTGCGLVYSDQVGEFVNNYANGGGRLLEGNGEDMFDGDSICAQMCIPHLIFRPALWGASQFESLPSLNKGTCEENGYDTHIADKTLKEYSVVFEVQLYTAADNED